MPRNPFRLTDALRRRWLRELEEWRVIIDALLAGRNWRRELRTWRRKNAT